MKRNTWLCAILALGLLLSGCTGNKDIKVRTGNGKPETSKTEPDETEKPEASLPETEAAAEETTTGSTAEETTEVTTEVTTEATTEETTEETTSESATETTETTEATTTETTAEPVPEKKEPKTPVPYQEILDRYLYHLSGNVDEDNFMELMGLDELTMYREYDDLIQAVGYRMIDLNDDGQDELVILIKDAGQYEDKITVLEIDTIVDGKAVLVEEGWARRPITLLSDKSILIEGSSGAANYTWQNAVINKDGTIQNKKFYFHEEEGWFESLDGTSDKNGDCKKLPDDFDTEEVTPMDIKDITFFKDIPHRYEFIKEDVTYEEAKKKCEEKGGHLVTMTDRQEIATVVGFLYKNYCDNYLLYVGAERLYGATAYAWTGDGEEVPVDGILYKSDYTVVGDKPYAMLSISGEDGKPYLAGVSNDYIGENEYAKGFIGYICEYDYE